jgi:hypothetical protein
MTNQVLKFTLGDGPKPKRVPGNLNLVTLRSPIPLAFKKGDERLVQLGFRCNAPLIVVGSTSFELTRVEVIPADTDAVIRIKAKEDITLEYGEPLVRAAPLGLSTFDME